MVKNCKNCEHAYYVYGCEFACKYYDKGECNERNLNHFESKVPPDLQPVVNLLADETENEATKKYLIAYVSGYNDRVLSEIVYAKSQKEAVYDFGLRNANCDIIAITVMEE